MSIPSTWKVLKFIQLVEHFRVYKANSHTLPPLIHLTTLYSQREILASLGKGEN